LDQRLSELAPVDCQSLPTPEFSRHWPKNQKAGKFSRAWAKTGAALAAQHEKFMRMRRSQKRWDERPIAAATALLLGSDQRRWLLVAGAFGWPSHWTWDKPDCFSAAGGGG
jgi:hypothetical protein